MLRRVCLALSLTLLSLTGCDEADVSQKYCNLPARFSFSPVSSVSQLYTACNSMGQWTTITLSGNRFLFANPQGSTPVNITQANNYTGFYLGLCGLLVGLPTIPELGSDYSVVTCYDLACSNCYEQDYITKPLTLQTGGEATCPRCHRTYDLNNLGLVSRGEAGKQLYRYRIAYANNSLVVNNR